MRKYVWLSTITVTIALIVMSFVQGAVFGQAQDTTVTLKGEIVDLHCFLTRHGGEGRGASHAGCANACLARNVTAGFVAIDGKVYLLLDEKPFPVKDRIAGLAGQPVTIIGALVERDGMRGILLNNDAPNK